MPKEQVRVVEAKMAPALGLWARRLRCDLSTFHLTPAMLRAIAMQDFPRFKFLVTKAMRAEAHAKTEKAS